MGKSSKERKYAKDELWEELKFPNPECGECKHWDDGECDLGNCIYKQRFPNLKEEN
jgi:hypothetical protein